MFITDWPMSLKQRLPGSDESRGGKVERSGVKDVVARLYLYEWDGKGKILRMFNADSFDL